MSGVKAANDSSSPSILFLQLTIHTFSNLSCAYAWPLSGTAVVYHKQEADADPQIRVKLDCPMSRAMSLPHQQTSIMACPELPPK